METHMNPIPATASTETVVARRIVSYILLAMFAVTAVLWGTHAFANANGLLVFLWLMSIFALASYWLRLFLDEHDYLEDAAGKSLSPNLFGTAFRPTPNHKTRA